MEKERHILLAHLGRSVLLVLAMAMPVGLLYLDIHWLKDPLGEWSLVELTQAGFLLACVLAFARLARLRADDRGFAVLAAGFFACMLVRELDAAFDLIAHGFWKYPALLVAAASIGYALRRREATLASLARFIKSRSSTVLTIGLVLVLFYSRLFGLTSLWSGLLEDSYLRVFKNAAEECTELLGYTLVMSASLAWVHQRLHALRKERAKVAAQSRQQPARIGV